VIVLKMPEELKVFMTMYCEFQRIYKKSEKQGG